MFKLAVFLIILADTYFDDYYFNMFLLRELIINNKDSLF